MSLAKSLSRQFAASIDPSHYLESLGFEAYEWQREVLRPGVSRLILNCARQSGKSTVIGAKVVHRAKFFPGSLIMLFAPSESQSAELMEKIGVFISQDPEILLVRDSSITKKFLNGSRIKAFTASPRSARGYSDPDIIVFDEAAHVERELYLTVRPMMTGGKTDLVLLSTPYGKEGFFYDIWMRETDLWLKVEVQPLWIMHRMMPEKYAPRNDADFIRERAEKGIKAFISTRHTEEFLLEEYEEMGEHWYMQEYGCEFRNPLDIVFDVDLFNRSFDDTQLIDIEKFHKSEGELFF
jgi:hypothetical protein